MGEGEGVLESSLATPYYHEDLYGDPNIVMDKEQMLQLLDSPDSNSMFSSPTEDLKRKNITDVPMFSDMESEGIAANDLGSLLEQFLEYEEKQVSSRPVSPQLVTKHAEQRDVCQHDVEAGQDTAVKNDGVCVFSGKLQDHNYAIPAFVTSKENCTAEEPIASTVPDADVKKMEDGHCDKDNEESSVDWESQSPSVDSMNGHHQSSNRENLHDELEKSGQCFNKSPQHEEERGQSPYNERSVELEKNWKSDTCRRERELKRRKQSYSSNSDDSDYDDSRDQSSRSGFHSQEKRSRSYGTSSDEESDRECKRYSLRRFERVHTQSKPENHGRNLRSRDRSSRLERNEMPRNRTGRKEEKNVRPHTSYDIERERKLNFKFNRDTKDTAKEERRIVYIGKIPESTTKDDVWKRFRPFGPIEKVSVHIRDKGDNYAFVTYFEPESAVDAIEKGNNSSEMKLDLCFGGRRKFCGGTYVDFDSNTSYLEKQQELLHEDSTPVPVSKETDFDVLLKMFQKERKIR